MKTVVSLIAWTIVGGVALTLVFTGHAFGWVGVVIAGAGIKNALWPSKTDKAGSWFELDFGGCSGCGGCGCGGD